MLDEASAGERNTGAPRERLLAAIVQISYQRGYGETSIEAVIERASVSRTTFYSHFHDMLDCLLGALAEIERRVLTAVAHEIDKHPPQEAAAVAVVTLVAFAHERPAEARLLMSETMAAGPRALDARDRVVEEIARLIEHAYRHLDADTAVPALPGEALVGAAFRLLASRLRHGEHELYGVRDGLLEWLGAYAHPDGLREWRTLTLGAAPPRSPFLRQAPLRAPAPPAPGRPRPPAAAVAENQRLRIIFATAEVVRREGYPAARVTAITGAAGVDGRVFYRLFASKQDAFTALHELAFQSTMAVTAGAYFAFEDWPRRIWEAAQTLTQHLEQNPALTHASLIEGHAGDAGTVQRFEALVTGFTIFLQEGYRYRPRHSGSQPSLVPLETLAQAAFEILYRRARSGGRPEMAELAAQLAYLCLAPFVGAAGAGELIEEMKSLA